MSCQKCGSEKTKTRHTDGLIVVTCKDCGEVVEERYGYRKHQVKTEAEQAAETVQG